VRCLPDYTRICERAWSLQNLDVKVGLWQLVLPLGKRGDEACLVGAVTVWNCEIANGSQPRMYYLDCEVGLRTVHLEGYGS
jgi:hypothetical protein